jgi:hypothetical protein
VNSEFPEAERKLGHLYVETERFEKAIFRFNRALKLVQNGKARKVYYISFTSKAYFYFTDN